ncbi:hypothetical protein D3C81_2317390 [compost metagenome]
MTSPASSETLTAARTTIQPQGASGSVKIDAEVWKNSLMASTMSGSVSMRSHVASQNVAS